MYDFCATHNCTIEAILENDKNHIFQITGALNAVASIIYGHYTHDDPNEDLHDFTFDMYMDVGINMGRLIRISIEYSNSDKMHDRNIWEEEEIDY